MLGCCNFATTSAATAAQSRPWARRSTRRVSSRERRLRDSSSSSRPATRGRGVSAAAPFYRWRQQHAPAKVDGARRTREPRVEVERLRLLAAELLLDKNAWSYDLIADRQES